MGRGMALKRVATALVDPAIAVAAGIAAAYGFPPNGHGLLTLAGIALVAWRLPGASPWRAAFLLWLFATAWRFCALAWISEAFLVVMPGMGAFALTPIFGLAAGLAIYSAIAAYLWRRFWPGAGMAGAAPFLGLAVLLSLAEWTMGHALTGFPWAITALAFADGQLAQNVRSLGAYGLSLTLLAATLAIAGAAAKALAERSAPKRDIVLAALALSILFAPWNFDPNAPMTTATKAPTTEDMRTWPLIRLVQGNTPQREKWRPENRNAIFIRHLELSRAPAARPLAAIVWPETATPFPADEYPQAMAAIAAAAPENGYVILGAPLRTRTADGGLRHTNSLIAVNANGAVAARYDKAHLVPGGEYIPFEDLLPFGKLVAGRGAFTPGPGLSTLRLPGLPSFSPLICYEVIFPGAVARADDRPDFLLNITNDAWYGLSAGPYQHLAIARLRAIEEGLPLIRVANTGISAAFDSEGRELGRIDLEKTDFLDIPLPPPGPPTIYADYGDAIYFCLLAMLAALAFVVSRRPRRTT